MRQLVDGRDEAAASFNRTTSLRCRQRISMDYRLHYTATQQVHTPMIDTKLYLGYIALRHGLLRWCSIIIINDNATVGH